MFTITNQARHLLICTLNSGRTIHLGPAEISEPLEDLEMSGNHKIAKLVRTGLVSIETTAPAPKAEEEKLHVDEAQPSASASRRPRREKE
jgi:hypothetical protein